MIARPSTRTILIGVALFFVFLIFRFPYRNLRGYVFGKIYSATQIRIDAEDLSPTFLGWPGVNLYKATLVVPMGRMSEMDLAAEQLTARVGIGGLFPPVPSLSLYFYRFQKGGNLYVKGSRSRGFVHGYLSADDLALSQFLQAGLPSPIEGKADASGSFAYDSNELAKSTGDFALTIAKLQIPALNLEGIVLPAVAWDEVKAKLSMKNGNLDVTECKFGSAKSPFRGNLSGYVKLGRDIHSSFVNLTLRIQMTDEYKNDPQSATVVSFLKTYESSKVHGEYALKWSATVADISTNIMMAIPTKAE